MITCDGLPFTLGQKVLKETFQCQICGEAIFPEKAISKHLTEEHPDIELSNDPHSAHTHFQPEFDWLLLKIGHGHFEMNMVRSFFELNWEIFVKDVAHCMGFCSEAAQKYAKGGSDHHKAWELLQVVYYGCIDEMLVPYVRHCMNDKATPTVEGFIKWSRDVRSPRFRYMQEQILTYAHAILTLRDGIRRNNIAKVIAGM